MLKKKKKNFLQPQTLLPFSDPLSPRASSPCETCWLKSPDTRKREKNGHRQSLSPWKASTWLPATTHWFLDKLMTHFSNIHPKFYSELQILLPYCQGNISLWYHRTTQVQHILNLNSTCLLPYEVCSPLLLSLNSSSVLLFRPKILSSPTTPLFCTSHVHPTAIPVASI